MKNKMGYVLPSTITHYKKKKKRKKKRVPVITVSTLSYKMLKKQETIKKEKRNGLQENTYK
jgi:hypothetical protein